MNSSASSCGVSFAAPQAEGSAIEFCSPLTWTSLNIARPHCASGFAPTGVLNEK